MSVTVRFAVHCDEGDCRESVESPVSKHEALRHAELSGWLIRQRRPRHTCPMHRPDRLIGNRTLYATNAHDTPAQVRASGWVAPSNLGERDG